MEVKANLLRKGKTNLLSAKCFHKMFYYQIPTTKQTKINELRTIPFINKNELMRPSKGIVTVSYPDVFSYH